MIRSIALSVFRGFFYLDEQNAVGLIHDRAVVTALRKGYPFRARLGPVVGGAPRGRRSIPLSAFRGFTYLDDANAAGLIHDRAIVGALRTGRLFRGVARPASSPRPGVVESRAPRDTGSAPRFRRPAERTTRRRAAPGKRRTQPARPSHQ